MLRISTLMVLATLVLPGRAQQYTLYGYDGAPGEELGRDVAALGDVDGDGVPDFAIGAPGDPVHPVRVLSGASGLVIRSFTAAAGSGFGSSMAAIGDVDGDGRSELAVAATTAGFVQLLDISQATPSWTWSGPVREVSRLGDADGDGVPDVLVLSADGMLVTLLSGVDGSVLRAVPLSGPFLLADGGHDVNGDGRGDFILGNPFYPNTSGGPWSVSNGRAAVHSGADGAVLYTYDGMFLATEHTGYGVLMLGDVNGDGRSDFAMGILRDWALADTGRVHVCSGLNGSLLYAVQGGVGFGAGVFPAHDVDQDGVQDFHVRSGSFLRTYSGASGAALSPTFLLPFSWEWNDIQNARATTAVGDLTGNGRPEVLVGHGSVSPGGAALVLSECTPSVPYCVAAPNSVSSSGALISAGPSSVSANSFWLSASPVPVGMPGIFVYGKQEAQIPFADGFLCLSPGGGVFRILPAVSPSGFTSSMNLDLTQYGAFLPGTTWSFQLWYRDIAAGGSGSNLSNGVRVTFCP